MTRAVLEEDLLSYPGWGLDGAALHSEIPAHGWCVTPQDFRFLRQQIKKAVMDGVVTQVPIDPVTGHGDLFDLEDKTVGPSMYNVVNSFLKPLSANAGNMSWALLRNPEGLPCDVFITHAWAEGAYELIEKVLASLPFLKTHVWCCILAIPQNLNISHLISEPKSSPFAQALSYGSHMVVVPTQRGSIYKRIWCVYEAHLASTEGKTIYIGRRSAWFQTGINMCCLAITVYGATLLSKLDRMHWGENGDYAHEHWVSHWEKRVALAILPILLQVCLGLTGLCYSRKACTARLVNNVTVLLLMYSHHVLLTVFERTGTVLIRVSSVFILTDVVYVCVDEVCRASREADEQEAQLLAGFTSVLDAEASLQEDKDSILRDIGEKHEDVDFSVNVLLAAGMSTSDLRRMALLGVDVTGMASCGLQQAILAVVFFAFHSFLQAITLQLDIIVAGAVSLFPLVCWTIATKDRKPFFASSFVLLELLQIMLTFVILLASFDDILAAPANEFYFICPAVRIVSIVFLPMMLCCCLGPHRLARIPVLGAWLVGVLGPGRVICPRRIDQVKTDIQRRTSSQLEQSQEIA